MERDKASALGRRRGGFSKRIPPCAVTPVSPDADTAFETACPTRGRGEHAGLTGCARSFSKNGQGARRGAIHYHTAEDGVPRSQTVFGLTTLSRATTATVATMALLTIGLGSALAVPAVSGTSVCTADGSTLREARANYAANCSAPRADCDPTGPGWVCSSETIGGKNPGQTPTPPALLAGTHRPLEQHERLKRWAGEGPGIAQQRSARAPMAGTRSALQRPGEHRS